MTANYVLYDLSNFLSLQLYAHIGRYYSFLRVLNLLRSSDSELILKLIISLGIW